MAVALSNPRILRPAAGATAWLLLGLTGLIGAGWGYGLFFASMLLLAGAAVAVALLALTRAFDTDRLRGSAAWLGLIGVWTYVWAVGALAGHYTHETFAGRMELRWVCSVRRCWRRWWCSTWGCTGCWSARTCRHGIATAASSAASLPIRRRCAAR